MDVDLFYFWRWLLVLVCTVYWLLCLGQTLWGWYEYLWAGTREAAMMRRYLFVQVLRVRVHRFTLELVQIVALLALLAGVMLVHRVV